MFQFQFIVEGWLIFAVCGRIEIAANYNLAVCSAIDIAPNY
jgi:hypothetical protein